MDDVYSESSNTFLSLLSKDRTSPGVNSYPVESVSSDADSRLQVYTFILPLSSLNLYGPPRRSVGGRRDGNLYSNLSSPLCSTLVIDASVKKEVSSYTDVKTPSEKI